MNMVTCMNDRELKLPRVYFRREAAQQYEILRPNDQPGPGYTPMLGASQLHGNGPWSNLTKNNMGRGFLPCRLDARRSAHPGNFRQHLQQRQWWWLAVICMHAWSSHIICKIHRLFPRRVSSFLCALALEGACWSIMPHNEPNVQEPNTLDDYYAMVTMVTTER